jgi:integrase
MSVLFNHAIRWEFTDRNPISGPNKGAGVRQSSKRQSIPDILEVSEVQAIVAELQVRERVLLFLDMATGLRRGELAGVKWHDFDFTDLDIDVQRSVVDQVVGRCKTEASQKRVHGTGFAGLVSANAVSRPRGLRFRDQQQPGGKEARKATIVVVNHHALLHPASGQETRHPETSELAHLSAHLYDPSSCQRGRRQGGAGVVATQLVTHHDGHLRAGADARKTGGTTESGGDGADGKASAGGQNNGLTAPQNAPQRKRRVSTKLLILNGVPDGI